MSAFATNCQPPGGSPRRQIPSLRNREVFAAIVMGKSHEKVAAEFKLSQPRVTQIVQQVRDWTVQTLEGEDYGYTAIQQLRLAEATLRIQLDGWMRMSMEEWERSCREKYGRTTFLGQASRLAMQLARLAGVDVSGKTARLLAQQQAQEEARLRSARAEKPLWERTAKSPPAATTAVNTPASTPAAAEVCARVPAASRAESRPGADEKYSYGLEGSATAFDLTASLKDKAGATRTATPPAAHDKPIPKFLDKKVRKRLLAMRRQEARAETLAAVG
jgi:hypothetical protein